MCRDFVETFDVTDNISGLLAGICNIHLDWIHATYWRQLPNPTEMIKLLTEQFNKVKIAAVRFQYETTQFTPIQRVYGNLVRNNGGVRLTKE